MLLAEIPIATTTTIVLMGMMQDLVYVATTMKKPSLTSAKLHVTL